MNDKLKRLVFSIIFLFLSLDLYLGTRSPLALIIVIWGLAAILMSIMEIKEYLTHKIEISVILPMIIISGLILIYTLIFRTVYLKDQVSIILFYVFSAGLIICVILAFKDIVKILKIKATEPNLTLINITNRHNMSCNGIFMWNKL